MPLPSHRLTNLPPYIFAVIGDRIRQMQNDGIKVYRLDIGNPDMPPPKAVIEALGKSAENPSKHGYSGYRGITEFRVAIADHYQSRFGVSLNPDTQVLPLIGSKEGIVNLCFAYLDKGDVALVPEIGYPAYSMGSILAGAENYYVPMDASSNYELQLDEIPADILSRAKLLWVNYPNNPTGAMVDAAYYRKLAEFCKEHDLLLISDNPYVDVVFDREYAPTALLPDYIDNIVELYSFSKSYNMAGWRLGAAVGSAAALNQLLKVKSNIDSGHFKPVYDAGITALQTPQSWINQRNAIYKERQEIILDVLPRIGLEAQQTQGSLYVWAKVKSGNMLEYVEEALTKAHVSLAPGSAYGPGGENYIRMSIGTPDDALQEAMKALEEWYSTRQ